MKNLATIISEKLRIGKSIKVEERPNNTHNYDESILDVQVQSIEQLKDVLEEYFKNNIWDISDKFTEGTLTDGFTKKHYNCDQYFFITLKNGDKLDVGLYKNKWYVFVQQTKARGIGFVYSASCVIGSDDTYPLTDKMNLLDWIYQVKDNYINQVEHGSDVNILKTFGVITSEEIQAVIHKKYGN